MEQVARPGDGAGDDGQVAHDGWVQALLLILVLDLSDQARVLAEEIWELGLEARLQILTVEDALELAEKAERVLNVDDVSEVLFNVLGELALDTAHVDVELDEVTIEGVILVVK